MDEGTYIRKVAEIADLVADHVGGLDRLENSSLRGLWQRHHETIEQLLGNNNDDDLRNIMRAFESDSLQELEAELPMTLDPRARLLFFAAAPVAKELFRRTNAASRKRTVGGLPIAAIHAVLPKPPQEAPFILTTPTVPTQAVKRAPPQHETIVPIVVAHKAHGGPITRFAEAATPEQTRDAWRFTGKLTILIFLLVATVVADGFALAYLFQQLGFYSGGLLALLLFALEAYGAWRLAKYLGLLDE